MLLLFFFFFNLIVSSVLIHLIDAALELPTEAALLSSSPPLYSLSLLPFSVLTAHGAV